jgi:TetR/AcrR family transcriptional regulator
METTTPARTQAERADQTRARILDAAVRQFSANGLAGARTEQIAEEAGVNKALLYYYFKSKEELYAAALEAVIESVRADSVSVLEAEISAGERIVQIVLRNFDRSYSHPAMRSLMQQEMVRLHQGEENRLASMTERFFRPLWLMVDKVIEDGIAAGELIAVDPIQMRHATLGANLLYFLTAPLSHLVYGTDPLERGALEFRRQKAVEFLGQAIFIDREHGAHVAARVLAETPMPEIKAIDIENNPPCNKELHEPSLTK